MMAAMRASTATSSMVGGSPWAARSSATRRRRSSVISMAMLSLLWLVEPDVRADWMIGETLISYARSHTAPLHWRAVVARQTARHAAARQRHRDPRHHCHVRRVREA